MSPHESSGCDAGRIQRRGLGVVEGRPVDYGWGDAGT